MTYALIEDSSWRVLGSEPGAHDAPASLPDEGWIPATNPGTVATALRAAQADHPLLATPQLIDDYDWWFTARLTVEEGAAEDRRQSSQGLARLPEVVINGIATHWELFIGDEVIGSGRSMFRGDSLPVDQPPGDYTLSLVCRSLTAAATPKRPRAPWRSNLVRNPSFRWHRTSALGRIDWPGTAAPAGPWRGIQVRNRAAYPPIEVSATLRGADGMVRLSAPAGAWGASVEASIVDPDTGGLLARAELDATERGWDGTLTLPRAQLWWPHTHGKAAHYRLMVNVDGQCVLDRLIGFRTITADTSSNGFSLIVNGVTVFARGACWVPPDPLALLGPTPDVEAALDALAAAGSNLIRVTGTTTWQDEAFHKACIRRGLMLWQDCMLHTLPPVDDDAWAADLDAEVSENLVALQGQPHLAVISGGSETEQQPVLWGLPEERWKIPTLDRLEAVVRAVTDGVWVRSSPTGGFRPTAVGEGIAHYFGVGGYRRPLADAHTSGVRFAAECLAFSVPPERPHIRAWFPQGTNAEDPAWRAGITRDAGADWDFEDVSGHYVHDLLGRDLKAARHASEEAALDLLRAATASAVEATLSQWRRPQSSCRGAIILSSQDLTPGAGWGLLDSAGAPKATWWAASRAWAARTVLFTDEGLDGIRVHVLNDRHQDWDATLELSARPVGAGAAVTATRRMSVPARGGVSVWAEELLGSFVDLTGAWGFGPPSYAGLEASVTSEGAPPVLRTYAFAHTLSLTQIPTLDAVHRRDQYGHWLELSAPSVVPFVVIEGAGVDDNWFHLVQPRRLRLHPHSERISVRSALGGKEIHLSV